MSSLPTTAIVLLPPSRRSLTRALGAKRSIPADGAVLVPDHRPHHARPAGALQLDHRDRTRAATGPPRRTVWYPKTARAHVPDFLALVRATLWTGELPVARSRPPLDMPKRRWPPNRISSAPPPEHDRNRNAVAIPAYHPPGRKGSLYMPA